MSYDVFLSYANPDQRQANTVCTSLEAKGLKAWIAPRDIPAGAIWSNAILQAIDQSRTLVVIFSSSANQSQQVFREVSYADYRGLPLFLFRIENLQPSGGLFYFSSGRQWVDAWSGPLKAHTNTLLDGMRKVLANSRLSQSNSSAVPPGPPLPLQVNRADQRPSKNNIHNPYSKGWREKPRKVKKATRKYEEWLADVTTLERSELDLKHKMMKENLFMFLRATFYRWLEFFPVACPDLALAPAILAAGDLTVDNFRTWRDSEHRLNWGIGYFDEACDLPYTSDLVRLGTSARMALEEGGHAVKLERICGQILSGYEECLNAGGRPFVLEEQTARFRDTMLGSLKDPKRFWDRIAHLPPVKAPPKEVVQAFAAMMPGARFQVTRRVAGLASLGRKRFVALRDWKGGKVAWEAKALSRPAIAWITGADTHPPDVRNEIVDNAVRNPDPFATVWGSWRISRLSPDFSSVRLFLLRKRDQAEWLHAMGWETANIHLGTKQTIEAVKADLLRRPENWLRKAIQRMTEITEKDWVAWRK